MTSRSSLYRARVGLSSMKHWRNFDLQLRQGFLWGWFPSASSCCWPYLAGRRPALPTARRSSRPSTPPWACSCCWPSAISTIGCSVFAMPLYLRKHYVAGDGPGARALGIRRPTLDQSGFPAAPAFGTGEADPGNRPRQVLRGSRARGGKLRHGPAISRVCGFPTSMVLAQPDLGTSAVFLAIWIRMALMAGVRMAHIVGVARCLRPRSPSPGWP